MNESYPKDVQRTWFRTITGHMDGFQRSEAIQRVQKRTIDCVLSPVCVCREEKNKKRVYLSPAKSRRLWNEKTRREIKDGSAENLVVFVTFDTVHCWDGSWWDVQIGPVCFARGVHTTYHWNYRKYKFTS